LSLLIVACRISSFTYFSNTAPQNLRSLNPWSVLAFQYGSARIFSRKNRLSIIRNPHDAVVKCRQLVGRKGIQEESNLLARDSGCCKIGIFQRQNAGLGE
jgi:hypothetical protein